MSPGYEYTITAVSGPWDKVVRRINDHTQGGRWRLHSVQLVDGLTGPKLLIFERNLEDLAQPA